MTVPKSTIWTLEPHTRVKHEILRNYLNAWFPILGSYNPRVVYIDGFAGPGIYANGELGSPLIAMDSARSNYKSLRGEILFLFSELNSERISNLRAEISKRKYPENFKWEASEGEFSNLLIKALDELASKKLNPAPTFAFIDPFGFSGAPFSLVSKLLRYSSCEILFTFMIDSIRRFLTHPDQEIRNQIVDLFGSKDALSIADGSDDREERLRRLYQQQLKTVAKHVRCFEMKDQDGRAIYDLFFATNHELGNVRMKEAMWKADSEGDFRFSDATDQGQTVLFRKEHDDTVFRLIAANFGGKETSVKTLRSFIEDETPYLAKHLRSSLKHAETTGSIDVLPKKSSGGLRRKGTFPDEVLLKITKKG